MPKLSSRRRRARGPGTFPTGPPARSPSCRPPNPAWRRDPPFRRNQELPRGLVRAGFCWSEINPVTRWLPGRLVNMTGGCLQEWAGRSLLKWPRLKGSSFSTQRTHSGLWVGGRMGEAPLGAARPPGGTRRSFLQAASRCSDPSESHSLRMRAPIRESVSCSVFIQYPVKYLGLEQGWANYGPDVVNNMSEAHSPRCPCVHTRTHWELPCWWQRRERECNSVFPFN